MHSVIKLLVMQMVFPHGKAAGPQVKNQSHKTQLDSPHGGKPQDRQAGHAHFAADQSIRRCLEFNWPSWCIPGPVW